MTSLRAFVKFLVIVVSATTSIEFAQSIAFAQPPATPQWQTAAAGKGTLVSRLEKQSKAPAVIHYEHTNGDENKRRDAMSVTTDWASKGWMMDQPTGEEAP
jgi:hypothetical protein